jgi:uncharacterized membrane protein YhaH (DUF805 family)
MIGVVAKALNLRLNRRYFWIGFGATAGVTALMAQAHPWMLNGGFVLPWVLLHGARLHDFGRRGIWSVVVVTAILALLSGLAALRPPTSVYGPAAGLAFIAIASFSLFVGAKRGDAGSNKFGPAPEGWALR